MARIQSIPVELLHRIFTMGCEADALPCRGYHSTPRHLKPFLVPTVLVCKYWRAVTLSDRNPHFWTTLLQLGVTVGTADSYDLVLEEDSFKRCLTDSKNSDIVVQLHPPSYIQETTYARLVLLLREYAHQPSEM